jgi:hypothetical protein
MSKNNQKVNKSQSSCVTLASPAWINAPLHNVLCCVEPTTLMRMGKSELAQQVGYTVSIIVIRL